MKKRVWLTALTSLVLMLGGSVAANAEILPSHGFGQIGLTSVVLCDSLSLYQKPDTDSKLVEKLKYGDRVIVTDQSDGWARCVLGDSEDAESGWVKSDYIVIDPQWYMTEDSTTVYAWGDAKANKVGLLSKDTRLPILKNDDDWVVVSLRGASGWIRKTDKDKTSSGSAGSSTDKSASSESKESTADSSSQETDDDYYFTVYAEDGLTAYIHPVGGAMYEDAKGRTYILQDGGIYYCITTDTNYSADPDYGTTKMRMRMRIMNGLAETLARSPMKQCLTKTKSRNGLAETLARSPMRRCPTKTMMRIDVRNISCASQYMPR